FDDQGDGAISQVNGSGGTGKNAGLIRKTGGTSRLLLTGTTLNNTRTIEAGPGTISGQNPTPTQGSGSNLSGGARDVGAHAAIQFPTRRSFVSSAANVVLYGPGSRFNEIEDINTNSGTITLRDGRDSSITRNVVARQFNPGLGIPTNTINASVAFDPATGNI